MPTFLGPTLKKGTLDVPTKTGADADDELQVFSAAGAITVGTGAMRFPFPYAITLLGIRMAINTAPAGAALIVDVNKNGTTVFTTQANRPQIAAGAFATAAEVTNMEITSFAAGDYVTVDRDQVGSTTAGSDLTVLIRFRKS